VNNVLNKRKSQFLREIKGDEVQSWKPQKQSVALEVIEDFLSSHMEMAEVDLDMLPEPEQKAGSKMKSTKQDSFASSFYAWKKKDIIQERLAQLKIDILLIRRGEKVALKKVGRKR
jgi:hypothetical protein